MNGPRHSNTLYINFYQRLWHLVIISDNKLIAHTLIRLKALTNENTETMWSWRAFCSFNTIPEGTQTNHSSWWKFNTLTALFGEMMWHTPSVSLCRRELPTADDSKMQVWSYPIPTLNIPFISLQPGDPHRSQMEGQAQLAGLGIPKNPQYFQ